MTVPDPSDAVPLVSVVIAAFDAERTLGETLDSVLAQDHPALDVVVVDDGSTDATADLARSYGAPVRTLTQPHRGLGAAQNRGIAAATGEYLSFIDADDLWVPDKTSRQLALLRSRPDVDLVFSHLEQFVTPMPGAATPVLPPEQRVLAGYSTGTMLVARATFDRVGPLSESAVLSTFIDWYARAQELGLVEHLMDEVLMRRRVHGNNMGVRMRDQRADYLRTLKHTLDRRRGAASHESS